MSRNDTIFSGVSTRLLAAVICTMGLTGALLGVSPAGARTDGPIIIPPKVAPETAPETTLGAATAKAPEVTVTAQSGDGAVDLTDLIKTIEDNDSTAEAASAKQADLSGDPASANDVSANDASAPSTEDGGAAAPSVSLNSSTGGLSSSSGGLKTTNPSSIRLASLGNDRDDMDGLGRLMWEGSNAGVVLDLMTRLDGRTVPTALKPALHHVMVARAVPPEGFVDLAQGMVSLRLDWLAAQGASDDLAALIRQLPDVDQWQARNEWLALHNLLTRNDEDACAVAGKQVMMTLEPLWHQINAFCAVVAGDHMKASFAIDILEDSGVDDPLYFALMRQLTGDGTAGDIDQADLTILHLVLMDSARITIAPEALANLPTSYTGSVEALRYLSPDANRLLAARKFGRIPTPELTASWALVSTVDIASAEALTRLRFGGDADTLALSRLNAWQAISSEKDDAVRAQLALEALVADHGFSGSDALGLWLGYVEGGVDDLTLDEKIGPLLGFGEAPSKVLLNDTALAWHGILDFSPRQVPASVVNAAEAHDAIALLAAVGQSLEGQDWLAMKGETAPLAGGTSLPYATLMSIEAAAKKGMIAETLLRATVAMNGVDLAALTRDDAARLAGALHQVGLEQTARGLAKAILKAWGLNRHFANTAAPTQEAS